MRLLIEKLRPVFNLKFTLIVLAGFLIFSLGDAQARELVQVANATVTTVKRVAQAISVLGIISGGVFMQIPGMAEFGKRTLAAGLIGSLCSFGGPAFIEFMQSVFGT